MTLRLYNTLTKSKDEFVPLEPKNIRMYVCGPTVYDFAHIGNARPAIVFDVLFRLLRHEYGEAHVTYARNITDVDDKINARAAEVAAAKGISVEQARAEVTAQTERQYVEDVTALGCLPPDKTPRATENIAPMVAIIEKLVAAGHAYAAEGHVLFDISSKADYGKLSRRSLDEMIAGSRVEVAPYKKNPMDFVLWKPSDASTPGWDSPWGRGRPGWHIECSAMIAADLGPEQTIDIHGGGIDLVFPHHENEIAQSEGAHHGHALANVWMHNGFLQVEGEKMSKSLGNFRTIHEELKSWTGDELRFAMLQTHYRQPIDWTKKSLEQARTRLKNWREFSRRRTLAERNVEFFSSVESALSDDVNTPEAFAIIDQVVANNNPDEKDYYTVYRCLELLGFRRPHSLVNALGENLAKVSDELDQLFHEPKVVHEIAKAGLQISKEKELTPENTLIFFLSMLYSLFSSVEVKYFKAFWSNDIRKHSHQAISHDDSWKKNTSTWIDHLNSELKAVYFDLAAFSERDLRGIVRTLEKGLMLESGNGPKAATRLVAGTYLFLEKLEPFKASLIDIINREIGSLVEQRNAARKAKDFAESDRIRDDLLAKGIVLKDGPDGTTWEIKR